MTKKGETKAYPDPFAARSAAFGASFFHGLLATALFRCWHILIFFTAWATVVTVISHRKIYDLYFSSTLLTVLGTVLGFVISYRTTASFERYNEGRRLWSQIILANRTFSRTVWFHVPENMPYASPTTMSDDEKRARVLIEKKTIINLLEAYAVAVKHYLRGEDGIFYKDLYFLVKYLPSYALPAGRPSMAGDNEKQTSISDSSMSSPQQQQEQQQQQQQQPELVAPASPSSPRRLAFLEAASPTVARNRFAGNTNGAITRTEEQYLLPSRIPSKYHLFDLFPFTLVAKVMIRFGYQVKGKKAARARAKLGHSTDSHNIPLEISLYLSSYIAALQNRKAIDAPTTNTLLAALNQLVDGLTGLERILTTPIPFSYSVHLWVVTTIYCLILPPQLYSTLKWLTIPGTTIVSFIFFGFLVAGEEIENPFGYDKNDLNLDHFTHNIIRNELRALTATPPPDPSTWAFSTENDVLFCQDVHRDERIAPEDWVHRGYSNMQSALTL